MDGTIGATAALDLDGPTRIGDGIIGAMVDTDMAGIVGIDGTTGAGEVMDMVAMDMLGVLLTVTDMLIKAIMAIEATLTTQEDVVTITETRCQEATQESLRQEQEVDQV